VIKPLLFFAFSSPKSIFLPMFILVFGVGFSEKVGFGFFSTIFIVIISTTTAVESVKVEHLTVARSDGATTAQTAFRVYLPSMLPVLLEALRISMIFNLTGVILADVRFARRYRSPDRDLGREFSDEAVAGRRSDDRRDRDCL
jgi:ABC-type nitrate/sulfonate/bicarbonate transport system permease component